VSNHATHWGFISLSWSSGIPLNQLTPDNIGALTYFSLAIIEKLAVFSVPAFLFVSGFFVSYAARGAQNGLSWKVVTKRIVGLAAPYLIWSIVIFLVKAIEGEVLSPLHYLTRLLTGGAIKEFFFVPVLCQLYVLAPLLVTLAKTRWRTLLLASVLIQLVIIGLDYLSVAAKSPGLDGIVRITGHWSLFPKWAVFFILGIVAGFHIDKLPRLYQLRWWLLAAVVLLGILAIVESEVMYRLSGNLTWRDNPVTLFASLYAITFTLCFLALHQATIPFSKFFQNLSGNTFGIYLLHPELQLIFTTYLFAPLAPWLLANQLVLQPLLVTIGIGIPLLFMTAVKQSPLRRYYSYLFG
jgi:hypothetical protein